MNHPIEIHPVRPQRPQRRVTDIDRRAVLEGVAAGLLLGACKAAPSHLETSGVASALGAGGATAGGSTAGGLPSGGSPRDIHQHEEMPMRELGRTGVKVSLIGLGGFHIGLVPSEDDSIRLIRSAIDRGVTFLDNCWDYNGGQSEIRVGKALRDGYRAKSFLMTKLDGRTADAARRQLDQSLRRLQTDVIDLVQVHEVIRRDDPERVFASGGAIEALVEARRAGKIRFIGFTGHKDPSIHLHMLNTAKSHGFAFDTIQMPLNVMDAHYRSFERDVLPVAVERGLGILGMKSLGDKVILRSRVVSPVECLHYAMSLPTSVVITGCESMPILDQAIRAAASFHPLSGDERNALLERTRQAAAQGEYERFKTSGDFDGTTKNPRWLTSDTI